MANWNVCFDWLLDNEDLLRAYATVKDSCPKGIKGPCFAISGVNSGAWPAWFAAIDSAPYKEDRARMVERFYQKNFWNQWFDQITSDEVAKRVFDMAVNGGAGTSTRLLQQAVNSFHVGNPLVVDGGWGPKTVNAANLCNPLTLVAAFQNQREDHYRAIVVANPADAKYLAGWLARARR